MSFVWELSCFRLITCKPIIHQWPIKSIMRSKHSWMMSKNVDSSLEHQTPNRFSTRVWAFKELQHKIWQSITFSWPIRRQKNSWNFISSTQVYHQSHIQKWSGKSFKLMFNVDPIQRKFQSQIRSEKLIRKTSICHFQTCFTMCLDLIHQTSIVQSKNWRSYNSQA